MSAYSSSSLMFTCAEEIGVLFTEIGSSPLRNMARDEMKRIDAQCVRFESLLVLSEKLVIKCCN